MHVAKSWAGLAMAVTMCVGLPACSREQEVGDRLITTQADNQALNAAMEQARATQDSFWAKFESQAAGTRDYALKLELVGRDGFHEHIWAEPIARRDGEIVARLANEPSAHLADLKFGSEVRVKPAQVSDWAYEKDGKLYGHFTTRVLFAKATPEERAEVEGRFSPTPLEPNTP